MSQQQQNGWNFGDGVPNTQPSQTPSERPVHNEAPKTGQPQDSAPQPERSSYQQSRAQFKQNNNSGGWKTPPAKPYTPQILINSKGVPLRHKSPVLFYILGGLFALTTISGLESLLYFSSYKSFLTDLCVFVLVLFLTIYFFRKAFRIRSNNELLSYAGRYDQLISHKKIYAVDTFCSALTLPRKKVVSHLQALVSMGYIKDMFYDPKTNSLEFYAKESGKKKEPQKKKSEPTSSHSKYDEIIDQIQYANTLIPGEEISQKIDVIEELTAKIFECVKKRPEKESQVTKFMDYYLPTTLKLLNNYHEFESQQLQTEKIMTSMKKIEETLDKLVIAFERLLEKLMMDQIMDVSADIQVLNNMLSADGLAKQDFEL